VKLGREVLKHRHFWEECSQTIFDEYKDILQNIISLHEICFTTFQYPFVKISMDVFVVELFFFRIKAVRQKQKTILKESPEKMEPCLTGRTIGSISCIFNYILSHKNINQM